MSSNVKALCGAVGVVLFALAGCGPPGPSEERLGCLNGCAREKDECMLNAMTPPAIAWCDGRARACGGTCPE
jgi:hypothetical protein